MGAIAEETLGAWSDIHDFAKSLKPKWIFRGQNESTWALKSSLERCCERQGIDTSDWGRFEAALLREFRRAYHQYAQHVPHTNDHIEWLSLMQHHGAPTRLLDFTYSIYIAVYFAVEAANVSEDCALWAVDSRWALQKSIMAFKRAKKPKPTIPNKLAQGEHDRVFCYPLFFKPTYVKCATPLNPFRLNERLRAQKGVFLVPGDPTVGFMENLQALPKHDDQNHIVKLIIPSSMRSEALRRLYDMNISRTSLFPGLDGYAQSLAVYHPSFDSESWV